LELKDKTRMLSPFLKLKGLCFQVKVYLKNWIYF
jgi:hypothetical protein